MTFRNPLQKSYQSLFWGGILLLTGIMLGAFAAHGLKQHITPELIVTFQTGVTYQLYHGLALLFLGLFQLYLQQYQQNQPALTFSLPKTIPTLLHYTKLFFLIGVLLFSLNCYLYAVTQVKFFALIVPFGGVSFLLGWFIFILTIVKIKSSLS